MGYLANEYKLVVQINLPSSRWRLRRIRKAYDKKLRYMDKEHTQVRNQILDLGYEELNPPIQRGYKRLFVLTEETQYSKSADFYQGILDKINTIRYSPHKTFKEKKRKIGKWKYQLRTKQELSTPDSWSFHNRMNLTEEEKRFFFPIEYYDISRKSYYIKYEFIEPWRFRLRIVPHLITQVQIKDSQLERYCKEIKDYLDRDDNARRLTKMRGYKFSWKKTINEKEDLKKYNYNSLNNRALYDVVEECNKEKQV